MIESVFFFIVSLVISCEEAGAAESVTGATSAVVRGDSRPPSRS